MIYFQAQFMKMINLFRTLNMSIKCKNIHIIQAKKPLRLTNGKSATALF